MPSYIELDKQATFPASSDVSKVILGINTNNVLQITSSDGQSINASPSYKVYTALVSQTGASNILGIQSGALVIGVTYTINDYISGDDFTNVGAPLNQNGVSFVATGTTPSNWNESSELVYDEGAPVVNVLENTIGNIWFTYDFMGQYIINSDNLFVIDKTINTLNQTSNISSPNDQQYFAYCLPNGESMLTIGLLDSTLTNIDDALYNKLIEIRVYN